MSLRGLVTGFLESFSTQLYPVFPYPNFSTNHYNLKPPNQSGSTPYSVTYPYNPLEQPLQSKCWPLLKMEGTPSYPFLELTPERVCQVHRKASDERNHPSLSFYQVGMDLYEDPQLDSTVEAPVPLKNNGYRILGTSPPHTHTLGSPIVMNRILQLDGHEITTVPSSGQCSSSHLIYANGRFSGLIVKFDDDRLKVRTPFHSMGPFAASYLKFFNAPHVAEYNLGLFPETLRSRSLHKHPLSWYNNGLSLVTWYISRDPRIMPIKQQHTPLKYQLTDGSWANLSQETMQENVMLALLLDNADNQHSNNVLPMYDPKTGLINLIPIDCDQCLTTEYHDGWKRMNFFASPSSFAFKFYYPAPEDPHIGWSKFSEKWKKPLDIYPIVGKLKKWMLKTSLKDFEGLLTPLLALKGSNPVTLDMGYVRFLVLKHAARENHQTFMDIYNGLDESMRKFTREAIEATHAEIRNQPHLNRLYRAYTLYMQHHFKGDPVKEQALAIQKHAFYKVSGLSETTYRDIRDLFFSHLERITRIPSQKWIELRVEKEKAIRFEQALLQKKYGTSFPYRFFCIYSGAYQPNAYQLQSPSPLVEKRLKLPIRLPNSYELGGFTYTEPLPPVKVKGFDLYAVKFPGKPYSAWNDPEIEKRLKSYQRSPLRTISTLGSSDILQAFSEGKWRYTGLRILYEDLKTPILQDPDYLGAFSAWLLSRADNFFKVPGVALVDFGHFPKNPSTTNRDTVRSLNQDQSLVSIDIPKDPFIKTLPTIDAIRPSSYTHINGTQVPIEPESMERSIILDVLLNNLETHVWTDFRPQYNPATQSVWCIPVDNRQSLKQYYTKNKEFDFFEDPIASSRKFRMPINLGFLKEWLDVLKDYPVTLNLQDWFRRTDIEKILDPLTTLNPAIKMGIITRFLILRKEVCEGKKTIPEILAGFQEQMDGMSLSALRSVQEEISKTPELKIKSEKYFSYISAKPNPDGLFNINAHVSKIKKEAIEKANLTAGELSHLYTLFYSAFKAALLKT